MTGTRYIAPALVGVALAVSGCAATEGAKNPKPAASSSPAAASATVSSHATEAKVVLHRLQDRGDRITNLATEAESQANDGDVAGTCDSVRRLDRLVSAQTEDAAALQGYSDILPASRVDQLERTIATQQRFSDQMMTDSAALCG